jgi:hypothetical protein
VIDGTVAQHAGTAEDLMNEDVVIPERRRHALVGGTKDRGDRNADCGSQVHRSRIIRHERVTGGEQPRQQTQVGPSDEVDGLDFGRQRRFYRPPGFAVRCRAYQQTDRTARVQARHHFGDA